MLLPHLPPVPEADLDRNHPRPYPGLVEIGDVFAWEPDIPSARMLCIVTAITDPLPPLRVDHPKGTAIISRGSEKQVWTRAWPDDGAEPVNVDISRFREAVVKTTFHKSGADGRHRKRVVKA
jgi:hypothetical protein